MVEVDPVELSEPADVVAWLRALPVGTVLLDETNIAWQVHRFIRHTAIATTYIGGGIFHAPRDADMRDLAKHAPFRVLWTPGGA